MHLIERYATSCGVKINKPDIYQKYIAVPFNNYIIFYPENSKNGFQYDHWQIVIDTIFQAISEKNIQIIQIGNKDSKKYNNCSFINEESIDFQNLAYLIKNAELVFGVDGINNHLASYYNKKIVGLYYNVNIENVKPYWGDKKNQKLLTPKITTKPFYGQNKIHKSINSINPEIISKNILDLLEIKYRQMINTVYIGNNFCNKTLDVIPDGYIDINKLNIENLIIRMDLDFNEEVLTTLLSNKKCIIITNKKINLDIIKNYKNNILQIVYILQDDNDPDFIKFIKNNNIKYVLTSEESDDKINNYKLKYMDYGLIFKKEKNKKDFILNKDKKYFFRCSKIYFSSKGIFNCKYAWINNLTNFQEVIDNDIFWEDLQDLHIFSIDNI